jgi:spermidine/putrescine transport system substrate-binding protein
MQQEDQLMPDGRRHGAIDQSLRQALHRGLTRRRFLRKAGQASFAAGAAVSLPSLLAACGVAPAATPQPTPPGGTPPAEGGNLNFANWPFYIDQDDAGASDTLRQFTAETNVQVNYQERIESNDGFFGTVAPALAAGQDTGWDLIVVTDWMVARLVGLGYLERIDVAADVPQFQANAADAYKDPWYDPGNQHSVPWQSGFTGIGYNIALTGREITSINDLWSDEFAGRVGMFSEMRDSMNFAMLRLGINPEQATVEDAQRAVQELLTQAPLVRAYYGNEYAEALANGDVAITMAWSGDVYQLQADNEDLRFVIPDEGANLWVDNMCIPRRARNPAAAKQMMDFVYGPEIAAQIAAYVQFISPVPAAREILAASDDEEEQELADSELIFPSDETLGKTVGYPNLDEEAERVWQELFQQVVQG